MIFERKHPHPNPLPSRARERRWSALPGGKLKKSKGRREKPDKTGLFDILEFFIS